MSPTRRRALTLAGLFVAAPFALAACGAPPPPVVSPNATRPPSTVPSASPPPSPEATAAASPAAVGPFPILVIRADEPDGLHWYATLPADPERRRPLFVPPGVVAIGQAGSDGGVVLMSAWQLLFAVLTGDDLTITRTIELGDLGIAPGDPACVGAQGSVAVADAETLTLTIVSADRAPVAIDVPDALGECAWLADGRLLVVREGDRLAAADPTTGLADAVSGGSGRHPSIAGGLLSLVDRSGPAGVPVRDGALGGLDGLALGPAVFVIQAVPGELIARAGFSPDARWLAVEVILDPESTALRRLRLYRVEGGNARIVTEIGLGAREQITILPAP